MSTPAEELLVLLRMRYLEDKTYSQIAEAMTSTIAAVRKKIKQAEDRGMIKILLIPPPDYNYLSELEIKLRFNYSLQGAHIVPGREDVMKQDESPAKEAVLISCCQKAATYLTDSLKDGNILAVPWGRVASYIASQLSRKRHLSNLLVVPMVGVMGAEALDYEANNIATRIASSFGGKCLLLAAPAAVETDIYDAVYKLPIVKSVLEKAEKADVVLTPIAAANPKTSTIVTKGLAGSEEVRKMIEFGAVGEIAGHWWFNKRGELIKRSHTKPIGLGIDGLCKIVQDNRRVVAVVAASAERILPLKVALENGFVNVLITDHITAEELLKDKNN